MFPWFVRSLNVLHHNISVSSLLTRCLYYKNAFFEARKRRKGLLICISKEINISSFKYHSHLHNQAFHTEFHRDAPWDVRKYKPALYKILRIHQSLPLINLHGAYYLATGKGVWGTGWRHITFLDFSFNQIKFGSEPLSLSLAGNNLFQVTIWISWSPFWDMQRPQNLKMGKPCLGNPTSLPPAEMPVFQNARHLSSNWSTCRGSTCFLYAGTTPSHGAPLSLLESLQKLRIQYTRARVGLLQSQISDYKPSLKMRAQSIETSGEKNTGEETDTNI